MNRYQPKIPKSQLVHGAYYRGNCRNATEARWNAELQQFFHWRHKFGHKFIEGIKAPEDDRVYDVFIADELIEKPSETIPFIGE